MVRGRVADELAVENAVRRTGAICLRCVKGLIFPTNRSARLKLISRWNANAKSTVTKNSRIAPKSSLKGACKRTGVTKPNTPMGAKRRIKLVNRSMTACVLSQNFVCAARRSEGRTPMNAPNRIEKVITPSSCPLFVAASTTLEGNILRKISKISPPSRPSIF